ncbi:MAG: heme lyase CcmF/NrfE family subunit [Chloroflexota bacterium]
MVANFGYAALVLAFLVSLYGVFAAAFGAVRQKARWVDSARNAMLLTWPLLTISAICIILLLVNGHYEVAYVSDVTSNSMPLYLRVTALWGGQAGSLIFWSWLMAAFASAVTLRNWSRDREFLPWVIVVSLTTLAFFLMLSVFVENPFERLWQTPRGIAVAMFAPENATLFSPGDGGGLNPLLRHPGMIIHPPMLYLGFVAFVIPYAFAVAALITGRSDDRWIRITRRWTLWAWLFLSLGLLLGGRWAYDVLGWGGYWGWDPVEIAAFIPWLTGTAFLHSVMIQEKRGMLKHWNMVLIIATYDLVIFGTFLTRSGVLSSVHAFAQSAIGPLFFAFIGFTLIASLALLSWRWRDLQSEAQMTNIFSREALFLVNNLLFVALAIICFGGMVAPIISEASGFIGQAIPSLADIFTGQKITVGPPYYESATGPLFAALLLLMGVAPLSAWGHSTGKTLGRAIWKPLVLTAAVCGVLYAMGVGRSDWWAILKVGGVSIISLPADLLAFALVTLAASVTVHEFWRGARARQQTHKESFPSALWKLAKRDRRRYGGYTIHLGVVLMALGIVGIEMYQTETQGTLSPGEQLPLGRYAIRYDSLAEFPTDDGRQVARATVTVYRDGRPLGTLHPRRDYYVEAQQPMTIPGVRSTMGDDFYVLLVDWQPISTQGATFKLYHNPLVNWLWLGGLIFILGTFVAAWPDRDVETQAVGVKRARKLQVAG